MTAEIHVFEPEKSIEQREAIEVLEEVLAEAKAGLVRSVAVAIVRPDGSSTGSWSSCGVTSMVGSIEIMKMNLTLAADE